jgi:hypothetical protein
MNPKLEKVLREKRMFMCFSDETWPRKAKDGWSSVGDVACSRTLGFVSVPRRRRGAYHFAEVLHEVAHLELWRETGKSPAKQDDAKVCELALAIGRQYGFSKDTIRHLEDDLAEQLAAKVKP